MNFARWISLAWLPAAIALGGARPDDGDDEVFHVAAAEAEIKTIEQHNAKLVGLAKEIQTAAIGGGDPAQAAAALEEKYRAQASKASDPESKEAYAYALRLLEAQQVARMREHQRQLQAKVPDWAYALRDSWGADAAMKEQVVSSHGGVWNRPGGAGSDTPFFSGQLGSAPQASAPPGGGRSKVRISQEIEQKLLNLRPEVERSKGALSNAEELRSAAAQNVARRKELALQADQIAKERESIAQKLQAEGSVSGDPMALQREMGAIKQANDVLMAKDKGLLEQQQTLSRQVDARKAQMDEMRRPMDADGTGFFNSHRSDCEVTKEWMEGNTKRWTYRYLPLVRLIEANKQDIDSWNQLKTQRDSLQKEAESQVERWNKLKKTKDALLLKQKLERLEIRHRETLGSIDQLKAEYGQLRDRMTRLLEELRAFSRRMGEWVKEVEDAAQSVRGQK